MLRAISWGWRITPCSSIATATVPHRRRRCPIRDEDGKIVGVVLVFRDVSGAPCRRGTAREAHDELQEADRPQGSLPGHARPELRNPLAPISNALELWPVLEKNPAEMGKAPRNDGTSGSSDRSGYRRSARYVADHARQNPALQTTGRNAHGCQRRARAIGPFIRRCDHKLHIDLTAAAALCRRRCCAIASSVGQYSEQRRQIFRPQRHDLDLCRRENNAAVIYRSRQWRRYSCRNARSHFRYVYPSGSNARSRPRRPGYRPHACENTCRILGGTISANSQGSLAKGMNSSFGSCRLFCPRPPLIW